MKKTVTILGMGIFGMTLAKALSSYNVDVIAIDRNLEKIEAVKDYVADAFCLDFSNLDELKAVGVADSDIGIVCTSERLEDTVMGTVNLKTLKVPRIICKSNNDIYSDILLKVGADRIMAPEKELAENLAKQLVAESVLKLVDIDDDHTIYDFKMPAKFVDKTLIEIDARRKYHINIIGIRRNGKLIIDFDPNEKLDKDDEVLMIGKSDLFIKGKFFG